MLLRPGRTTSNKRYYDQDELNHVMHIALLRKNGHRISQIASLSRDQIRLRARQYATVREVESDTIEALSGAMLDLDAYRFNCIIDNEIRIKGFRACTTDVIYPLINKLSLLWIAGCTKPVHEHFLNVILRQKIIGATELVRNNGNQKVGKLFYLFLPRGLKNDLSLLLYQYLVEESGHDCTNLGNDIGERDLLDACGIRMPDYLLTVISEQTNTNIQALIDFKSQSLPNCEFILSGYEVIRRNYSTPPGVNIASGIRDAMDLIAKA